MQYWHFLIDLICFLVPLWNYHLFGAKCLPLKHFFIGRYVISLEIICMCIWWAIMTVMSGKRLVIYIHMCKSVHYKICSTKIYGCNALKSNLIYHAHLFPFRNLTHLPFVRIIYERNFKSHRVFGFHGSVHNVIIEHKCKGWNFSIV
jgi:hypothetical protein